MSTLLFFGWFIVAIFLAFYIPGRVILGKNLQEFSPFSASIISLIVGMVMWGYQGAILGYVGIRFLSYMYVGLFFFLWLKQKHTLPKVKSFSLSRVNFLLFLIFSLGMFGQVQQFLITGMVFSDGIRIFTPASDDAFWHASLISQIVRRFPPFEPGLVNVTVYNYHYWSNLVIAELIRVFHIPLLQTQFQFMYVLISFLIGGVAYVLGKQLKFSQVGLALIVYLQYFASDVIYFLTVFTRRIFEFGVHPLEDGTMFLENPPRAFSFVIALGGASLLVSWLKSRNPWLGFLIAIIFGSIIGFKVHTGLLVLAGLGGLTLYFLLKHEWKMVFVPLLAVVISLFIYLPVNKAAGLPFFVPFERSREFVVQKKLDASFLELSRQVYQNYGNLLQAWRMDITILVVFLLAQFGIRNIGWLPIRATVRQLGIPIIIFLYSGITATVLLGNFFLQPVAPADTFNFFLAASLFLSVLTALSLSIWFDKGNVVIKIFIILIILITTVPRWIYKTSSFRQYFQPTASNIRREELEAMHFLKEKTPRDSVVLVLNKGTWDAMYPYVSIFSQRDMFLSGQTILGRHGIPFHEREKIVERILNSKKEAETKNLLKENNVDYLYFYGSPEWGRKSYTFVKKVFVNKDITIYETLF